MNAFFLITQLGYYLFSSAVAPAFSSSKLQFFVLFLLHCLFVNDHCLIASDALRPGFLYWGG